MTVDDGCSILDEDIVTINDMIKIMMQAIITVLKTSGKPAVLFLFTYLIHLFWDLLLSKFPTTPYVGVENSVTMTADLQKSL